MPVRFQVDPDFYDHPKSIGMTDAATALWVRAGSYSAAKLTDGFIAEHVLPTLSRTPDEASAELVRRGLWRRMKGGFRFHEWDERNLTRARVEGERAGDRKRKAEARAAARRAATQARGAQGQNGKAQAGQQVVHPDSGRNPSGHSPDSDGNPPVSVSGSVLVSVSGSGRPRDSPTADPPPPRCLEHANDVSPPPCGACADHRRARAAWDRDQARQAAEAQQAEAHARAEATRLAIDACTLCDDRGYVGATLCAHDPGAAERAHRGRATVQAAIDRGDAA